MQAKFVSAAVLIVLFAGQAQAQIEPPPPPPAPTPSIEFTKGPNAITNVRGVVFDVKWKDCTGIGKVEARVVKKGGPQLASDFFNTTDASASKLNWQILLPASQAGDVVEGTVFAFTSTGAEIAKTTTKEVTLK